jgi:VWFA-related protein
MRKPLSALAIASAFVAVGHAGQAPTSPATDQPEVTFRADANFVEVHAVVTDPRGELVTDLRRDEFEILEDGKPQEVSVFSFVDLPLPAAVASQASAPVESDVRATSRSFDGRLYVLVLDDLHTSALRSQLVRNAARQFVERYIGAGDLAAVVHTSGRQEAAQELTGSRRLLLAAIDKFMGQKLPSATAERLAIHHRESESRRSDDNDGTSTNSSQNQDRIADPYDAERGFKARRTLEMVSDVATWMRDIRGRRKALLLFSEGIDYDIYDVFNNRSASTLIADARDAIAAAQRANVGIYAVDPRGLTDLGDEGIEIASLADTPQVHEGSPLAFQRELLLAQESLMSLAEETGGVAAVRSNDLRGALARIARENSTYYLLGYRTDPNRGPGRFRKLDVRVKRPGLTVRARRGYVPPDAKALAKAREAEAKAGTSAALRAALTNPLPVGDLPLRVFAAPFKGTAKNASVVLAAEIDGKGLTFQRLDGRFNDQIELSVIAVDHRGEVRGADRKTLDLKLRPETHATFVQDGGARIMSRLELPPGRYQIRVGAHESVGGATGTVPYDLEVPDYSITKFALSGMVLTSTSAGAFATPEPDAALKSVLPAPPTVRRAFRADETLAFYAELYDGSSPLAHVVDITMTVRSASDGREVVKTTDERAIPAGGGVRTQHVAMTVPLKELAPGAYVLRVEAVSRLGNQFVFRELPFTVAAGS